MWSRSSSSKGALHSSEWKMRSAIKITEERKTREDGPAGKKL